MWYMLYCPNQSEREIVKSCRSRLSRQALQDAFVLTYDCMRRYGGAWHLERKALFPGYVFLESGDEEQLANELEDFKKFARLPGGENALMKVEDDEAEFLQTLCGAEHHLHMSRGYIRNGRTHVTEGPLQGKEGLIRKIDRHRRMAWVEVPGGMVKTDSRTGGRAVRVLSEGAGRRMSAGLEIVSKS